MSTRAEGGRAICLRALAKSPGHRPPRRRSGSLCANQTGFSLHAEVHIKAHDRTRLEQLCRMQARGPIASERGGGSGDLTHVADCPTPYPARLRTRSIRVTGSGGGPRSRAGSRTRAPCSSYPPSRRTRRQSGASRTGLHGTGRSTARRGPAVPLSLPDSGRARIKDVKGAWMRCAATAGRGGTIGDGQHSRYQLRRCARR